MPSLAEDLFERMLTLVPRRNLQSCYNKVSKDEILLVRTSVNDLLAAFTKLEEVRDAVTKLEQESSSIGTRNPCLLATMDSTLRLQKELENCLDKWVTGVTRMTVDNVVSKKRDREERYLELRRPEKQPRVSETGPRQSGRKEVIDISDTEESESTEETGMEDGDESGDTMAEKVTVVPRQTKKSAGKNVLKISGTVAAVNSANALGNTPLTKYMRFLEEVNGLPQGERTCRIPEAFTALKDWMKGAPGFKPSGAQTTRTLQYLIMWLEAFDGQCPVLDVYRSYLDSVKTFAQLLPASRHTVAIERQLKQLATLVKNTGKTSSVVQEKVSNETSGRTKTKRRKTDSFTTLVGELYTISHDERKKRVPELLAVFKDITEDASNTCSSFANRLPSTLNTVARWITKDPRNPELIRQYGQLVQEARKFAHQTPNAKGKKCIVKQVDIMSEILAEKPSPKARKYLKEIQTRAAKLLARLTGDKSASNLHNAIQAMEPIVQYAMTGWKPSQDPNIRQSIEIMKARVAEIKSLKARQVCETKLVLLENSM